MQRTLAIALLLACSAGARASDLALVSRQSVMSGNFLVGFATTSDRGDYAETFSTPDPSFSQSVADAGGVNGFHGATPVVGEGSYATAQDYAVSPHAITLSGAVSNTLSTPFSYVSAGANAGSRLELSFDIAVPTAFTLDGELVELLGAGVNGATPVANAAISLRGLSTGIGFWVFNAPGAFAQGGVLQPGRWLLSADASSQVNASAGYVASLALSPVPEPAAWPLLCAGLGLLMWRRRMAVPRPVP